MISEDLMQIHVDRWRAFQKRKAAKRFYRKNSLCSEEEKDSLVEESKSECEKPP